ASWQEEIGLAADLVMHSDTAPCVIFDEVPGYPKGHRVLVNFFGGKRKNMTLGFPPSYSKIELSEAFLDTYLRELKTIPHQEVADGPIFENVMMGDDVDVLKLPAPQWHAHDRNSVGFYISPGKHGRIHRDKYKALNQPMPTVIVLGGDPLTFMMACSE